jgi:V/A-type H+/Na+-transporting ATPase subunit C
MKLRAPADFSYGNTRLHARRSRLLRGTDYERLIDEDVDGLLTALDATPYAEDVEQAQRDDGLPRLHEVIRIHLGRALEEMRSFYAGRPRDLVDLLLSRFDIENVVAVLRAKAGTRRPAEAAPVALVSVGWLVDPLAREILGQRELASAVDLLARSTPIREQAHVLRTAFSEYERTENLAKLERAVVADDAARTAATLSTAGPDGRMLLRLMRRAIDERNLLAALRLRDALASGAAQPAEDTLLPGGSIAPARFEAAVRAPVPASVAGTLGPIVGETWRPPLARWAATGDLSALERELERRRIADTTMLFTSGDPLTIDVPLAFAAAQRTEARNLRLLGEAAVRGIHPDVVRRELIWPEVRP